MSDSRDTTYRIRFLGDPILHTPTSRVASLEAVPDGLLDAMRRICGERKGGVGISAPQVGASLAVALAPIHGRETVLIDPRITALHGEMVVGQEGCLSIPEYFTSIPRRRQVTVEWRDAHDWALRIATVVDFEARCVQHELDHLAGRLITDGLPRQQRRRAERLVFEALRREAVRC